MKHIKHCLSFVFLFTLFVSVYSIEANGFNEYTQGIYTYKVENNEAIIVDCAKSYSNTLVIPNTLGKYPVTTISGHYDYTNGEQLSNYYVGAFQGHEEISRVIIPDSVKTIGSCAFKGCNNLTEVEMPEGLVTIKGRAFDYCAALNNVKIPNSVTYIGDEAFQDCYNIKTVTIGTKVKNIGMRAFSCCTELENITIPSSVKTIGNGAFEICTNLTKVVWNAKNVESTDRNIFYRAGEETDGIDVIIGNSVKVVPAYLLWNANNINSVTIGENVIDIGEYAFAFYNEFPSVKLGNKIKNIGRGAFDEWYSLENIYYNGSKEEWELINIDASNYCLNKAEVKYGIVHTFKTIITPASTSKNGKVEVKCNDCDFVKQSTSIPKIASICLSKTSHIYNGKIQKPTLVVKDSSNKTISSKYYNIKWSNSSSKNIASYTATVTFKENYTGTKVLTYTILPGQVKGLKASSIKLTSITLSWSKVSGAKYYKLERSIDGKKWTTIITTTSTSYTLSKLKAGTKYQFKVVALDSTKKLLGKPSSVYKTQTICSAPNVSLTAKTEAVTVSWKRVTGASKYKIYKSTDQKKWTNVITTTKTSYTISKLTGGNKIYVKVVAVNAYGKNSSYSSVKYVTVKKYIPTKGDEQALRMAKEYLDCMAFSKSGLIEQLEYEGFSHKEATYAVEHCGANWKKQAVKMAKEYLDCMAFSKSGLIEQLEYEGFTHEEAVYGVSKAY